MTVVHAGIDEADFDPGPGVVNANLRPNVAHFVQHGGTIQIQFEHSDPVNGNHTGNVSQLRSFFIWDAHHQGISYCIHGAYYGT
jgi:hypothetical protein